MLSCSKRNDAGARASRQLEARAALQSREVDGRAVEQLNATVWSERVGTVRIERALEESRSEHPKREGGRRRDATSVNSLETRVDRNGVPYSGLKRDHR